MTLRVCYSAQARKDLSHIRLWTVKNFGSVQANHYLAQIDDLLRFVAENPGVALDASGIRSDLKKTVVRSHVAFFRVSETSVDVVRILHGGMYFNRWL